MTHTPMREKMARMLAANDPSCQFTAEACLDPATTIAPTSHYYQMVDALLKVLETPSEAVLHVVGSVVVGRGCADGDYNERIGECEAEAVIAAMVKAIRGGS